MYKNKVKLTLFALALFNIGGYAQSAKKFSLEEAKRAAIENNLLMKNADLDVEIAKKKVWETTAIGLPQVKGTADYSHIFNVPKFSFGGPPVAISPADNTVFKLQVSQLIFSGEYLVGLQATKVYKTISEQALVKNRVEISSAVETTYYMAMIAEEKRKIIDQNIALTAQTYNELKQMQKAGFTEDTDVDQLGMNLKTLESFKISLEGQLSNLKNQIKSLTGIGFSQPIELSDSLNDVITSISPFDGHSFDIRKNIDYKMGENQIASQDLLLKKEKSTYLPTLSGFYQHQEWQKVPLINFEPKDILGVNLTWNLFTSGSRISKVKQARFTLDKARNSQLKLTDDLTLKYENQRLNYQTAYNNFVNKKESAEISQRIFEKTNIKFKKGVSSSADLTQIQTQYLSTVEDYYTAVQNLLNARIELIKMMAE